jgi:integrase
VALVKLTEKSIRALKAPEGKQVLFWDTSMPGFGVLCSANGNSQTKSYVVKGIVRGRPIRKTIERVDLISLSEARAKARKMKVEFHGGIDPRAARTGDGVSLHEALDTYLSLRRLKPRSQEEMRAIVERHLSGWLNLPLWSITRTMVEQRHKAIAEEIEQRHRTKAAEDGKRQRARAERTEAHWPEAAARHRAKYEAAKDRQSYKGHATANGAMGALRSIWNFMADRDDSDPPRNPVRLLGQWYKIEGRTRLVKTDELPAFYKAVVSLENKVARDYILLMLFTGLRRREASSLRWEDIDLQGRVIHLAASKTKANRNAGRAARSREYGLYFPGRERVRLHCGAEVPV